ncbi:MAG: MFS transporter [Rhodothermaceae bacterium]|nr:MAG: MFS transporter [Rhodothermaceae bacterium]
MAPSRRFFVSERSSNPYVVLFALWLMVFSASSQVIIISPILPRIGEALHVPEVMLGWLITAYAVMLSVFALVTGPISDRVGRRRILLVGSAAMSGALYLHVAANSFVALLAVRAVAGAAGGMLSGGAVAYVGDYFPYERRGWANGWVMSGIAFGQIVGIPAGTLLADAFGFRWAFFMFALTMTAATVLIARFVPQPDVERDRQPLTIGRALHNYRLLLQRPPVVAAVAIYFLMFFSIGLYVIYLPTWLERTLSVSGTVIASLFFVGGLANVLTGPMAGWLSDRLGRKPLIITSCLGLAMVMLGTSWLVTNLWTAYLFFALAMVMVAMRISPLQSLMTALVDGSRRGILMSLAVAIGQVGIGIGGAVAGIAYMRYGYASNTLIGAVSIVLMAVLVHRYLPEPSFRASATVGPSA